MDATDARPSTPWLDLFERCEQSERVAELLGAGPVPWGDDPPDDVRAYCEAVAAQDATLERWAAADRLALDWWRERQREQEQEAARTHAARAIDEFMSDTLPARAGRRARAVWVLALLSEVSCKASIRFGALAVDPPPPPELAAAVADLEPELCDLIAEGDRRGEA